MDAYGGDITPVYEVFSAAAANTRTSAELLVAAAANTNLVPFIFFDTTNLCHVVYHELRSMTIALPGSAGLTLQPCAGSPRQGWCQPGALDSCTVHAELDDWMWIAKSLIF